MPLLPRTRSRLGEDYLSDIESLMDRCVAEVEEAVSSTIQHMQLLRDSARRLTRIRTGLEQAREADYEPDDP